MATRTDQPEREHAAGDAASLFVLGSFVVACSAKVARMPQLGESLAAEAFTVEAGGKGLNLCVGCRRLGAKVDGLFAVGTDFFSQLAEPTLTAAGLPATMLRRYATKSGSGIGFTNAEGENCLAVYAGANARLSGEDVRSAAAAVEGAALVLAQFEIGEEPILEAFTLAVEAGRRTLLNPSPYRPIPPAILKRSSVLVVNRVEADEVMRQHDLPSIPDREGAPGAQFRSLADALLAQGPDTIIVTLGARGAAAYRRDGETLYQSAFRVRAVDTLGAGDAFTAGLAVGLVEGRPLPESLRIAAACGAIATRQLGVLNALPTRAALEGFLSRRY